MLKYLLIILIVAGIGYAIYNLINSHKRSLTLTIAKPTITPGTPIHCTIILENQKMIRSNDITLTLIGMKEVRERGKGLVNSEVHRSNHIVVSTKTYPPKNRIEYAFDVPTPEPQTSGPVSDFGSSIADQIKSQNSGRNQTDWRVEVTLNGDGVTLTDSQSVTLAPTAG